MVDHLRRSRELFPPFREQARGGDDFPAVRDDLRSAAALRLRPKTCRCRVPSLRCEPRRALKGSLATGLPNA
jgi:hypothetical protein